MATRHNGSIPGEISWKKLLFATTAFMVLDFGLYLSSSYIFRQRNAQLIQSTAHAVPAVDDTCLKAEQHMTSIETEVRALAASRANETFPLGIPARRATTRKQLEQLLNQSCVEWRPCALPVPCQH